MKLNEKEAIATSKVFLVPYCRHHVPAYHAWMKDDDLREATASQLLTLEEEYAMQQSWRSDRDKLTFIICLPLPNDFSTNRPQNVEAGDQDAPHRMIGDINLFLLETENDDQAIEAQCNHIESLVGEISMMISRRELQRRGYGRAALSAFVDYILSNWQSIAREFCSGRGMPNETERCPRLAYLQVRISETNERSIRLFKSVGFVQTSEEANYFGEYELRWTQTQVQWRQLQGYEEFRRIGYVVNNGSESGDHSLLESSEEKVLGHISVPTA